MLRRILFWGILAATVLLATTHGSAVSQIVVTARYVSWPWFVLAVVVQVGYFCVRVQMYREAFRTSGIDRPWTALAPVLLAAVYLNTVAPGAGLTASSVVAQEAIKAGAPADRASESTVISQFAGFAGFAVVELAGFAYLVSLDAWHLWEVVALLVVAGVVVILAAGLASAVMAPERMRSTLARFEFSGSSRSLLSRWAPATGWSDVVVDRYADAARAVAGHPLGLAATWLYSVAMNVLGLASFMAVGFALGWPVFGALIAAWAVGTIVWLLSPIPQGIGVVEAVLALMLASFGADAPTALAISLAYRALAYWLPLAIGWALASRIPTLAGLSAEAEEVFPVRLAAAVTFLVGVANVLAAVTPRFAARFGTLGRALPLQAQFGRLSSALAGIALMMVARGLWRRKRLAWLVTVLVLAGSIAAHLFRTRNFGVIAVSLALLVFLLMRRREFRARSDTPSIAQGLRVLAAAALITIAYGTLGFFLLDRQYSINFTFWSAVWQTFTMFTLYYDPLIHPVTRLGEFFEATIYVVSAATFGFALFMLLRPVLPRGSASSAERRRAEAIVDEWGSTPLAQIALLADKRYFFSPGGSFVSFRMVNSVALALGDPIGSPEDAPSTIQAFTEWSRSQDWTPAFYQTLPDHLDAYHDAGLSASKIGHDAVVDAREFSLSGKRYRVERNLVNRLTKDGYTTRYLPAPQPPALVAELRDVSDTWLAAGGGSEMAFSLGWFDDEYVAGSAILTVEGPTGEIEAFANVLVERAVSEVAIDLMRYRPSAPDGVMDFLFIRLIEWARENGFETFNLGFSALSGVGEAEDPAIERALGLVYEYGNRFYSFKGLYQFKQKFRPDWQPRYIVYPDASALPGVLAALVRANAGESGGGWALDRPARIAVDTSGT